MKKPGQQEILPPLADDEPAPGAADPAIDPDDLPPELAFTPVEQRTKRWTGIREQKQRLFIAHLAATGAVTMAARAAGHSNSAFYQLRKRAGADSFATAWYRAVDMGARRVADLLMEYAIYGVPETWSRDGRVTMERRRPDIRAMQHIAASRFPLEFGAALNPGDGPATAVPHAVRRLRDKWRAEWEEERRAKQVEYDRRQKNQDTELDAKLRLFRTGFQRAISHDPVKRAAWDMLTGPGTDWEALRKADAYLNPQKHEWHMHHPDMIIPIAAGAGNIDWREREGGDLANPNPPPADHVPWTEGGEEDEVWFELYEGQIVEGENEGEGEGDDRDPAAEIVTRDDLRCTAHSLRERAEAWQAARPPVLHRPHGIPRANHMSGGPTSSERDRARRRVERDIEQLEREWNAAYCEESWAAWKAGGTGGTGRDAAA